MEPDPPASAVIINLTERPVMIYAPEVPDEIDPAEYDPVQVIPPENPSARVAEVPLEEFDVIAEVPVARVRYGHQADPAAAAVDIPEYAGDMPAEERLTWFIVELDVAMAAPERGDLLLRYDPVTDRRGRELGYRMLSRPVPAEPEPV